MLACLSPLEINVFPEGTKDKKDGSPGHFLSFNYSDLLPDIGDWRFVHTGDFGSVPVSESFVAPRRFTVPCGKCLNCRRNKSFRWSRRLLMESDGYKADEMQFITLTYDDEHLPADGKLHYVDFQNFMKRLRKACPDELRFFMCGEYGDQFGRCHFHCILFGHDFFTGSKPAGYGSDQPLFSHSMIEKAWKKGFAPFGSVDAASIQYVAGYVTKKQKQENKEHPDAPPFIRMSLKPGIGRKFLLEHLETIKRDHGFYLRGKFYQIDSDSLRFLIKECSLPDDLIEYHRAKNEYIAELVAKQYKLVTDKDKIDLDKTLASWYNVRNRLGYSMT